MVALIKNDCINCEMCVPECPNNAIDMGTRHYKVNAALCTECADFYDEPACIQVCPIDCIDLIVDLKPRQGNG